MTEDRYRLGTGRHRLGPVRQVRLQVEVDERHYDALIKLRVIRGIPKSEAVDLALDLLLALPAEDLTQRIKDRRERSI